MSQTKYLLSVITLLLFASTGISQKSTTSYNFKKGEVIDLLFLNNKAGVDSIRNHYFKTASPVAVENGYMPLGGIPVKEVPIQGNYHPDFIALGKWPSQAIREKTSIILEENVPRFHQMRKEIWSTFNVAFFVIEEDIKIEISPNKYVVMTNLWRRASSSDFDAYLTNWNSLVGANKGTFVAKLQGSNAPFGYRYTPDYISITAWDSQEDFDDFYKSTQKLDTGVLQHINQFKLN